MFSQWELDLFSDMVRYGEIIQDKQEITTSGFYRYYTVKYENEIYNLTRCNGEWIYFHHVINGLA